MRQLLCSTLALTCAALPLGNASAEMHRLQLRFSDQVNVPTTTAAARRILGQDVTISDFDEQFKPQADGKTYRLEAEIPMPRSVSLVSKLDKVRRLSEGSLTKAGWLGHRMLEQRGTRSDIHEAKVSPKRDRITFLRNQKIVEEKRVDGLITDLMSLPYLWMGRPVQAKPLTVSVFDAKKLHVRQTFLASRMEIIFNKQRVGIVQFKLQKSLPTDADLTLWVREADGVPLRVQLGLGAKYGVSAVSYPIALPPTAPIASPQKMR